MDNGRILHQQTNCTENCAVNVYGDLKIFSANDKKLYPALQCIQDYMKDLNMQWNAKKCAVMNVKRGNLDEQSQLKLNDSTLIDSVTANKPYKFLGIHEHLGQDKNTIYEKASK